MDSSLMTCPRDGTGPLGENAPADRTRKGPLGMPAVCFTYLEAMV